MYNQFQSHPYFVKTVFVPSFPCHNPKIMVCRSNSNFVDILLYARKTNIFYKISWTQLVISKASKNVIIVT
jgi:hypothetical protein